MQGTPGTPGPRIPLKLKLQDTERGYYSNLFSQASQGGQKVSGPDAVTFFKRSGLSID